MKCKVCGKKMTTSGLGAAGIRAAPNCICGKVRARERIRGCPSCTIHGKAVLLIGKRWRFYRFTCSNCNKNWWRYAR